MRRISTTRFIPHGSEPVTVPGLDAIVYIYGGNGTRLGAIGYMRKQARPHFHYVYRDEAQRTESLARFWNRVKESQAYRNKATAARAAARKDGHSLKVGAIMYSSWGYDQTNVDFYEVVKTTRSTIIVRPIKQTTTETGFMSGNTTPKPGEFCGDESRSIFSGHGFKVKGHSLSEWDGRPKGCSWYA